MAFVRKCPALVALAACGTCLARLHSQDMLEIQNGTMYNMYWYLLVLAHTPAFLKNLSICN